MSAHTPGPWTMRATPESSYGDFAVQIGRDYVNLHNEGDAKLIAAAPKLLEALEKEQEWRDREAAGAIDPEWDYETMVGQHRRAAIAEATS